MDFFRYNNICTAWRKVFRKMWCVSYMTYCNIITLLSECRLLKHDLMKRFCKFGKTIFQKGSPNITTYEPRAVFGMNYCEIR